MTPDDPRHGSPAGAMQHWRDGEDRCEPCRTARCRAGKAARIDAARGNPRTVPLGDDAHQIIATTPRNQLSTVTGLKVHKLSRLDVAGPETSVHRKTRDRILAAGDVEFWTPVGIQRRLRALHTIGWSMRALALDTGMWESTLRLLVNRERPQFVRREFADRVIAAYDTRSMTVRTGAGATRARNHAATHGWQSPLSWLDIDDPNEDPSARMLEEERWVQWWESRGYHDTDQSAVERILAGEWHLRCSPADKEAVVARWSGSQRELEELTGWKVDRYVTHEVAA